MKRTRHPYGLTTPCNNCPFRSDGQGITLHRARVREIERSLVRAEFPCHKTTEERHDAEDESYIDSSNSMHCAGALILLEKLKRPSQMMRICERLGVYDHRKLDMKAPVYRSFRAMETAQPPR